MLLTPRLTASGDREIRIKILTVVGFTVNEVTIKVQIRDHVLLQKCSDI